MEQGKFSGQLCRLLSLTGNYEFLAKGSVIQDLKQGIFGKVSVEQFQLAKHIQVSNLMTWGWLPTKNVLFDMSGVPRATPVRFSTGSSFLEHILVTRISWRKLWFTSRQEQAHGTSTTLGRQ